MPYRTMMQGINAIREGHADEGARLLRIALRNSELSGSLRSTALMWLAETRSDRTEKLDYYQQALEADPDNAEVQQRIHTLRSQESIGRIEPQDTAAAVDYNNLKTAAVPSSMPPPAVPPPPASPPPPAGTADRSAAPPPGLPPSAADAASVQADATAPFYRTIGIVDGPNGLGTGFFVTQDGLAATTRFVVGGAEQLTVEFEPGRTFTVPVVRAFPEIDLAFLQTGMAISQRLPVLRNGEVPPETTLTALSHYGEPVHGKRRSIHSIINPEWIPTTFHTQQTTDVGGNPLLDPQGMLVGMLTSNMQRTAAFTFALNISTLMRYVDLYLREIGAGAEMVYCPTCGHLSRAGSAGAYYCEFCGAVLPGARNHNRLHIPQMSRYYDDPRARPCPHCRAVAGFYQNTCLACGQDIT